MLTELTQVSKHILLQIKSLTTQITGEDYSSGQELLSGNSIAKHIRHVIEMYEEMINGYDSALINYDARKRNVLLEHDKHYTLVYLDELGDKLTRLEEDRRIRLNARYGDNAFEVSVKTTIGRELAYNIEHAVHHMAIIQIVVKHSFQYIILEENFGVAYSTQVYQNQYVHA